MAHSVTSSAKSSNNGGITRCLADSSTASGRWTNSSSSSASASALAAKKFRALTQIHSEEEPHSVAQNLPPKPFKSGRRMSFASNPVPKQAGMKKGTDKVAEKGRRRHSDASRRTSPTGNSKFEGNSRFCFNPLPSLCFAGTKQTEAEDAQSEVSTKAKHENASDSLPVSGEHTERIMVYVRVRPLSKKEGEVGARNCVYVLSNRDLYLNDSVNETDYLRLKRDCGRHYTFDAVFPDSVEQQEVYDTSTAELVDGVLQGRNASVLCYGATGAGKTHTMLGTVKSPGVMVIAIKDLFAKLEEESFNGEYVVTISYLEVYNEAVKDLLSPGKPLFLREDKQGNVSAGLTQHDTYSAEEVMVLLHRGNQNRTTEATRVNETSSRSHAILQVMLEYKIKDSTTTTRAGKLSLVDLAGSERTIATEQRTVRSVEGANINKSLLALSSCIRALVEQKSHVPYRQSKLTQLLKDSLGGACHTTMIANISPSNTSYSETQNTLHWANRAKAIRTKSSIANEELEIPDSQIEMTKQLLESQKQTEQLRMQVAQLEQRLLAVETHTITSSPSLPSSSPHLPSPYTPPATTAPLSRNLEALKEESDHRNTEYNVQLKHKDNVMRKLYQMGPGEEQIIHNNVSLPTSDDVSIIQPSKILTPKKPTKATISVPHTDYESPSLKHYRRPRFSDVELQNPFPSPSPSPSPYRKLSLGGTEKKRPFEDISNNTTARESSSMETSDSPSMLLKPGFYREQT